LRSNENGVGARLRLRSAQASPCGPSESSRDLKETAMNKRPYQVLVWLAWLTLPLTALQYWLVWDRLPARMATHFNAAGQPNGWMTREQALTFGLGITILFLVILTVISYVLQMQQVSDAGSWAILGLFAVVVAVIFQGNRSIIHYNLTGRPISIVGPFLLVPVVIVLIAIYLGARRGKRLPDAPLIAEERHASLILGFILMIPLIAPAIFANRPDSGVRWAALPVALVLAACAAFAWNGFQYRFSREGIEIRTLGFRLRSIPATQIRDYTIEPWNVLRGYGIRGIGRSRAYVWGNKVVHIRTSTGDVYLGHGEPERIIRDLDAIKQFAR